MKKYVIAIAIIVNCFLIFGCSQKTANGLNQTTDDNFEYVISDKDFDSEELGVNITNEIKLNYVDSPKDAEIITGMIFKKYQDQGFFPNFKLQRICYYSTSGIWIATFYEDPNRDATDYTIGPECSIAIKDTSELIGVWVNE